jgi:hypothetical protein
VFESNNSLLTFLETSQESPLPWWEGNDGGISNIFVSPSYMEIAE